MSGEIKHEWDGTILTVTSDSGTTASDLQGPKGDVGPRGPQGPAGVVYDADGKIVFDPSIYATQETVDAAIANMDLTKYASKNFVSTEIAKAQLEGAGVDTSGFATLDDLESVEVNIDNKTIVKDADGSIRTSIGGYSTAGGVDYKNNNLYYTPTGRWGGNGWVNAGEVDNIGTTFVTDVPYQIKLTFADGYSTAFKFEFKGVSSNGEMIPTDDSYRWLVNNSNTNTHFSVFTGYSNGNFRIECSYLIDDTVLLDAYILTGASIYAPGFVPISANYIPVDGKSIFINDEGKLSASFAVDEEGNINLDNYYTKAEIDAFFASGGGAFPSSEEVEY